MSRLRDLALGLSLSLAALPAAGEIAFVTCQTGDAVSVLDLDTGAERARWEVPGKPAGIAVGGGAVFVVSPDSKTVWRYGLSGEVTATAHLDGGPIGAVYHPGLDRLFVSDWYNARLWALDGTTLEVRAELPAGAAPAGLALSQDGRLLAAAERDADRISLYDPASLALLRSVPVGSRPFGLGFAPDGRLFVGNVGSNDVTVIAPASGKVLATMSVGERPYGVAFAAGRAFVTNQYENTLSVVALEDLSPVATLEAGEYPEGIAATADGRIAVANWFDNTLSVIDAETLETVSVLDTADGPRAFGAFLFDGVLP
ncbi:YncE family protein [Salipiger bermudensis]|uniref:YncE family protein n=1 Tax=Salipiger bermudensis TaxID=344736 RepID=UPI001CD6243C|nr:YncE family protein [Salipiger bermudensis]MCA0963967.1 YncE family protein [Salipiger bermudensis]